ncbi:MAG: GNAT family N-acetyltransferase [Bacteroidia bacterium]
MKIHTRPASIDEWQDVAFRCAWATWFHTPEWYRLWNEYSGSPFAADAFELPDGRKAIFPYHFSNQLRGLTKFRFTPAGTYGGLISADEFSEAEITALRQAYERKYDHLRIREFPLSPFARNRTDIKTELTYLIPIHEPVENIIKGWRRNHQRNLRQVQRLNPVLHEARTEEEWKLYFQAYQETFVHWTLPESEYDWRFFELLHKQDSPNIKLWLLKADHGILTGCICFYHNNTLEAWHQATFDKFRDLRPNACLYAAIIHKSRESGYCWFDLGPSGFKENVAHFKRGFSPRILPSNLYIRTPKWLETYQHVRKSLDL